MISISISFFLLPLSNIRNSRAKYIYNVPLGHGYYQIYIYMHLFPGGCLLSVLTTRYRFEADVTVKIEKQLLPLPLLSLLLSSGVGEGKEVGEGDLSVPWACGSDVWTGSIINGVSRNFWFHGHSGIFTLLGIVPLLMTRDSELELYFCDGLISEIAGSAWA